MFYAIEVKLEGEWQGLCCRETTLREALDEAPELVAAAGFYHVDYRVIRLEEDEYNRRAEEARSCEDHDDCPKCGRKLCILSPDSLTWLCEECDDDPS